MKAKVADDREIRDCAVRHFSFVEAGKGSGQDARATVAQAFCLPPFFKAKNDLHNAHADGEATAIVTLGAGKASLRQRDDRRLAAPDRVGRV